MLPPSQATRGERRSSPSPTCQTGTRRRRPAGSSPRSAVVTSTWPRSSSRSSVRSARSRSSSLNTSSSSTIGAGASSAPSRSRSASFSATMMVRCWPRLAWVATSRPRQLHPQVVALRPDQADAVPQLLLARVGDPAAEGRHQRLGVRAGRPVRPGVLQGVEVGESHAGRRRSSARRDGVVQVRQPLVQLAPPARSRAAMTRAPDLGQLLVPEAEALARSPPRAGWRAAGRCAGRGPAPARPGRAPRVRSRCARIASRNRRRSPASRSAAASPPAGTGPIARSRSTLATRDAPPR